mgnify:CR=1 FL=1
MKKALTVIGFTTAFILVITGVLIGASVVMPPGPMADALGMFLLTVGLIGTPAVFVWLGAEATEED